MAKKFLSPIKLASGSVNPETGTAGELFFREDLGTLYTHDGTSWGAVTSSYLSNVDGGNAGSTFSINYDGGTPSSTY